MLYLNSSTSYYWYNGTADMRKGFDSLCGIVQEHMHSNVLQGGVYIFVNRKRNQIKLLSLCKRLHNNNYVNKKIMQTVSLKTDHSCFQLYNFCLHNLLAILF